MSKFWQIPGAGRGGKKQPKGLVVATKKNLAPAIRRLKQFFLQPATEPPAEQSHSRSAAYHIGSAASRACSFDGTKTDGFSLVELMSSLLGSQPASPFESLLRSLERITLSQEFQAWRRSASQAFPLPTRSLLQIYGKCKFPRNFQLIVLARRLTRQFPLGTAYKRTLYTQLVSQPRDI